MNVTLLIGEPTQTFDLVTHTGSCVNTMQLLQLACGGCACCSCAYFSCIILGIRKSLRAGKWTDNWLCASAYIQSNKTPAGKKKKKKSILNDPVALRAGPCMLGPCGLNPRVTHHVTAAALPQQGSNVDPFNPSHSCFDLFDDLYHRFGR